MTNMRKEIITLLLSILVLGCTQPNVDTPSDDKPSNTPYVKGADISWLTQMESEGLLFYNRNCVQMECTQLMQELGMNAIRLRVWVNPSDGWCAVEDVIVKAKRAQKLGMNIMIDFHYSDSWADPGKQNIPSEWINYNLEELKVAVAGHTTYVLSALKAQSIDVSWVQVGNETATGMLWPVGKYDSENKNSNYAELTKAAYAASKAVYPEALVAIHIDQGDVLGRFTFICDYLNAQDVSYDMIAMSLYPNVEWKEQADNCISNIRTLKELYSKEVMIAEIGLEYFYPEQTKALLEYMIQNTKDIAIGIFYWEPQAAPNYNGGYNKGAFKDNRPTVALDAFTMYDEQ